MYKSKSWKKKQTVKSLKSYSLNEACKKLSKIKKKRITKPIPANKIEHKATIHLNDIASVESNTLFIRFLRLLLIATSYNPVCSGAT